VALSSRGFLLGTLFRYQLPDRQAGSCLTGIESSFDILAQALSKGVSRKMQRGSGRRVGRGGAMDRNANLSYYRTRHLQLRLSHQT